MQHSIINDLRQKKQEQLNQLSGPKQQPNKFRGYWPHEVKTHNTKDNAWVIVGGQVLDVTSFLSQHPGGESIIMKYAGSDCTDDFAMLHDSHAASIAQQYSIGFINQKSKY